METEVVSREIDNSSNSNNFSDINDLVENSINQLKESQSVGSFNDKEFYINDIDDIGDKYTKVIKLVKGNIPINQELLNKYKGTTDMFNDANNNYNGEVDIKITISELQSVSIEDMKIGEVKKLAKTIYVQYNSSKYFYNDGNKILVNNTGIDESISKIFESRKQRDLLKEHLLVFSDLGDIIVHSKLAYQALEMKGRENYNSWNYYYDNLKIGDDFYNFEFEVVSMKNGENHYRVQKLEKICNKKTEVSTGSTNNGTLPVTETSVYDNNIASNKEDVK
jgi:hypothetical protein